MKLGFKLINVALLALFANVAFATPVYTGDTDGSDFGLNPSTPTDSGYYIWSTSATDWSIRWTGNNNGDTEVWDWFGMITVADDDLETVTDIQFESRADSSTTINDTLLLWNAVAGPAWDGIDFSLYGESRVIAFRLGSTLFDSIFTDGVGDECDACASEGIYISDQYYQPLALIDYNGNNGHTYQQFEVKVPEPGTLALLGLGLLGMGVSRRKAV